jgi:hypothetical protein
MTAQTQLRPATPATVPLPRECPPQLAQRRPARPADGPLLPGACGWFDSSHELSHGLQVLELTTPESLAAALPLSVWLQLQCGGAQQPA